MSAIREAMIAALREAMQEPGFGYIDFSIRDGDARVDDELAWIVDAILPAVDRRIRDAARRIVWDDLEMAWVRGEIEDYLTSLLDSTVTIPLPSET